MRLGLRLNLAWDPEIATLDVLVPVFSVQLLVEKSLQHAFYPRSAPGQA